MTDLPARFLAGLGPNGAFGLAVSGGGDSMAMLHLAVAAGIRPAIVTVDHGLRAESAAEAALVARVAADCGLTHDTLLWQGWDQRGNLQDAARKARRRMIGAWAVSRGISSVALGHTQDDVAETFLMRLARGAGVDGLTAMSRHWSEGGITWTRPLLDIPRADLRDWLTRRGLTWIEDPSNAMPRYDRVKMRQAQPVLDQLGLRTARLADVAAHLADARLALDALADHWAPLALTEQAGSVMISADLWQAPVETQRRLIQRIILWIAPAAYGPRGPQVTEVLRRLVLGQAATLAGLRFMSGPTGMRALRESKAAAPRCAATKLWDGRWHISGDLPADAELGALGAAGLAHCPDWRETGLPRAVLLVSPAVWLADRLIAAPFAGFGTKDFAAEPLQPLVTVNTDALSH